MAKSLAKSRNEVLAQPVNNPSAFWVIFRAGADRQNNFVATARQTDGYVFAVAPRSPADQPPARSRNKHFEPPFCDLSRGPGI
jgi:hypothetical protein